jgi:signal transduction histidine kinase/DNA-binding response OmpR family regulator
MQGRQLRLAIALAASLLMAALGGGTLLLLDRMRQTAATAAREMVERSARVVETAVNRHLLAVDGMLAGLPAILGAVPRAADGLPNPAAVDRLLRDLNFQNFTFRNLMLVGADGRAWAAALPGSRRQALQADVGALIRAGQAGTIAIFGPVQNATTGEWAIYLARQVTMQGIGPMLAVAEVPVALITMLVAPYGELRSMRLTVERTGGLLLTSSPHEEAKMGRMLGALPPETSADGLAREAVSRFNGATVFRADRPTLYQDIYVTASIDANLAMAEWRKDRNALVAGMVGLSFMLLCFALAMNLALRQRERNEAERAAARRVLENAIESLADGFVMFDADDRLVVCNQRYRDFYAVTGPFVTPGIKFSDMIREGAKRGQYPQAGADIEAFVQEIQAWHRGNHPPMERLLPDGRWVLVTERRTPDGGTVGVRTDITALKEAMANLAAARDAAAAATEAKSRFLARMSHELRTPLNGVLGLAQALAHDPTLPEAAKSQARTLEMAGRHLLSVANDVLDLARIETGTLALQTAPTDLPALIANSVTILRPQAEERGVQLLLTLDAALPRMVLGDETRLRQVLLNLLSNAVKFSPKGGQIELRARVAGPANSDDRLPVLIEVRDEGPGVPVTQRAAIFGDFVQIERTGTPDGAGLGLSIAAHIVERLGGTIGCGDNTAARNGHGALFWVSLPMLPAAVAPATVAAAATGAAGRPLRILVADDVPANLLVARALLESAGHHVETAADGEAAFAAVHEALLGERLPFDAVLMDVMMPWVDGLEATRRIRALGGNALSLPIIAVTASAYPEDVARCRAAGMNDHIVKPIDRATLLLRLETLLSSADHGCPPEASCSCPAETAGPSALPVLTMRDGGRQLLVAGLTCDATMRLLPEFTREIRTAREQLLAADCGCADVVMGIAHRLAGSAATLGAERLMAAARRLETLARALPPAEPAALGEARADVLMVAAMTLTALEEAAREVAQVDA